MLIRQRLVSNYVCVVFFEVGIRVLNRSAVRVIEADVLLSVLSNCRWLHCVFGIPIIEIKDIRVLVRSSRHLRRHWALHKDVIVRVIVLDRSLIEGLTLVSCGNLASSWGCRRLYIVGKQALSLLLLLN